MLSMTAVKPIKIFITYSTYTLYTYTLYAQRTYYVRYVNKYYLVHHAESPVQQQC